MKQIDKTEIEIKKIDYLFDGLMSGLAAVFVLSSMIFYILFDSVNNSNLIIWFIANIIAIAARLLLYKQYKNNKSLDKDNRKYYITFSVLTILNGLIWGSAAFVIFPQNMEQQMVLILLVGGLMSGATVSLSSKVSLYLAYSTSILIPYIYVYFVSSSDISNYIAISLLLYYFLMIILSRKIDFTIEKNIMLAYQNGQLIEKLELKVREAEVANQAKSEFLSVMSHEIRTPLNAIIGFVQILKKSELDKKKKHYLEIIYKSSHVLINVINDILDLTKLESGKFIIEKIDFNPYDEFTSVYTLFEQNAKDEKIVFINSVSKDIPKVVQSDILRVKQILSNLLSNAIKFTPEGKEVELIVTYDYNNSILKFEVRDEGIGISKENIQKVTEAFSQADSSTAREYGGTGLGLSIVTKLLDLLDSKLCIESKLGEGSSFSFKIEAKQSFNSISVLDED